MVTRYVNRASTAGGDGTTNATAGANRAYATLSEAEASLSGTFSDTWEIICTGSSADTTGVTFDGFTTSGTNTLTIKAASGDEPFGIWSTSKYRLSTNSAIALRLNVANIFVQDLQIEQSTNGSVGTVRTQNSNQIFDRCFIRTATGSTTSVQCVATTNENSPGTFRNCIIWNRCTSATSRAISDDGTSTGSSMKFYNCTIIGTSASNVAFAIRASNTNTPTARNCLFYGHSAVKSGGNWNAATNYNASDLSTTTGGANDRTSQTFTFVDAGSGDFHLQSSDAGAKDFGEDLSAVMGISTDVDGDTRSGSWDIGFDEVTGGATTHDADLTETGTPTDTQTAVCTFVASTSETGAATDSQSAVATFVSENTESVTASDSQTGATTTAAEIEETLTAADSSDAIISQDDACTESVTAADSSTATVVFAATQTESLTATDAQTSTADFISDLTESATATDSQAATADFTAATSESCSAADSCESPEGGITVEDDCEESVTPSDSCTATVRKALGPIGQEINAVSEFTESEIDALHDEIHDALVELEPM